MVTKNKFHIICISHLILFLLSYHKIYSAAISCQPITGNWSSTSTWVGGQIPTINDTVYIVNGANITLDVNATIYKIIINSGGTLNIDTNTLSLRGNGEKEGDLIIYGTLNLQNGTINLTGDFVLYGNFNCGQGTINFNGNDSQRMLGKIPTFYHLKSSNTNNDLGKGVSLHQDTVIVKGNLIVDGVFNRNSEYYPNSTIVFDGIDSLLGIYSLYLNHVLITSNATVYGVGKTIYLYGNWYCYGTFVCNYSTIVVKYDSYSSSQPDNQKIFVANPQNNPFWNLNIDKSQGKVSPIEGPGNTLGHIYVLNNFSVINGTWDVDGARQLYVGKNFIINTTGNFIASFGRVILNGSNPSIKQILNTGNSTLYKLTIDNTGAGIILASNVVVTYELVLINGIVYTRNGQNFFELFLNNNSSSSLVSFSEQSYIAGKLKRSISNGTYYFPVGTSNSILPKYRLIEFNFSNTGNTNNILVYQDSVQNTNTYYANFYTYIQPDIGAPQGTIIFKYDLYNDFESSMLECIMSVIKGTPNNWNFVLTTTSPATGGNNGTIAVQLPSNYSPYYYILGEPIPLDPNVTICDGESATVTITQPTGYGSFYWYNNPQGGTPIATGSTLVTPMLYDTTIYYIAYFNPQCIGHIVPIVVNVNDIPTANFVINQPICHNDTALVVYSGTASNNASFNWNFGDLYIVSGSGPGPYLLTGIPNNSYTISLNVTENGCTSQLYTQQVVFPSPLSISFNIENATCGNNNGSATANVNGGIPPYSYYWSNGVTTNTNPNLSAGTYYVTVIDNNGCTKASNVIITNTDAPNINVSVLENVTCYGGNNGKAMFTASGEGLLTYYWSNGVSGQGYGNIFSYQDTLSAGTYFITVIDQNGCQSIASLTITQPAPITISYEVNNVTCYGLNNGSIILDVQGGTPPYQYHWQHGSSTPIQTQLYAGLYYVTVTDNHNCTSSQIIQLNQPDSISFNAIINDVTCAGLNNGEIFIQVSGGTPPYHYLWNTGDTTASLHNLSVGTYTLNVIDANNCSYAYSATINQPLPINVDYIIENVKCFGESTGNIFIEVSGGNSPYSFYWSNNQNTQNLTNVPAGNYYLTITDLNNCTHTSNFIIEQPNPLVVTASSNPTTCYGYNDGSVYVTMSGGIPPYQILWNTGDTSDFVNNIPAGVYFVTITDHNNCTKTSYAIISQPSKLSYNVDSLKNFVCFNSSSGFISLSVSGGNHPYTILWNTNDSTFTIQDLYPGIYSFTITDNNNCNLTDTIEIYSSTFNAEILYDESMNVAFVDITGGFKPFYYIWSNNSTDSIIKITNTGIYSVTITDSLGCSLTVEKFIDIDFIIPNFISPNNDGKNDRFEIKGIERYNNVTIKIFDRRGELIFQFNGTGTEYSNLNNQWDGKYKGKDLPQGTYLYVIDLHNDNEPINGTITIIR